MRLKNKKRKGLTGKKLGPHRPNDKIRQGIKEVNEKNSYENLQNSCWIV